MTRKVALITGGAKGIGRAIALDLGGGEWNVAICYRTSVSEAAGVADAVRDRGGTCWARQCDVSRPEAARALVREIDEGWGRIDALIHCAGPYHRVELMDETVEGWHSMFDNNLHSFFYLARAAAPGMRAQRWGRIISFSMVNADQLVAQPRLTAHYIAKVGILALTRSLARTLAPYGITANSIAPGFIDSGSLPGEELDSMAKRIPAGYVGSVDDVVAAVRFLLSEEARYVNGTNIHVSGAWGI
jgi:3-oxoacyl-[acyl-carrier protein] reductase